MAGTTQSRTRMRFMAYMAAGFALVAAGMWFVFRMDEQPGASGGEEPRQGVSRPTRWWNFTDSPDDPDKTSSGKRTGGDPSSERIDEVPQFPLVDQVLSNEAISNEEAAIRLLEIASDKSLSLLEREEALTHGLNLDLPRFLQLVSDPDLPQPLAQRFFDEMLNLNDMREIQVRACIALVDHSDEGIRRDAAEQLAFYIGLEEWSGQPDVLKQEAYTFLEELAKLPKPEKQPLDPDEGIPETKPFNPLETDEVEDGALDGAGGGE